MSNNINDDILRNFGGTVMNNLNRLMETGNEKNQEISIESYSPYKTSDQIPQYFDIDKSFCVMSLNCQSINAKFDKLKAMLLNFKENNFTIHCVCLQETWVIGDDPDFSQFTLPGYGEPISLGATCGRHGGLAIYLAEDLPDLVEQNSINRAVPALPTGMEKEEETEKHLQDILLAQGQGQIVNNMVIPTPESITVIPTPSSDTPTPTSPSLCSNYNNMYNAEFKQPRQDEQCWQAY